MSKIASEVLRTLSKSEDPVDRELSKTLVAWQDEHAAQGDSRSLGYEPKDIRRIGAVAVIESRVKKGAVGFDRISTENSYEAIVLKFPDRFDRNVVKIASERIRDAELNVVPDEEFDPTENEIELEEKVRKLRRIDQRYFPIGNKNPTRVLSSSLQFVRCPRVKAYVLKMANGKCQNCNQIGPFKDEDGFDYLEVHHVKPLAIGGTDRVQNAVALCPNCHRSLHYGKDRDARTDGLYKKFGSSLIRE